MEHVKLPLKVGMLVRIRSLDEVGARSYGVRVQDITDTALIVQSPIENYRPVYFSRGAAIELSVTLDDPPGKEGRYRGETVIMRSVQGQVPLLQVRWPEKWEREQLREFFRVPVALDVKVRPLPEDDADDPPFVEGTMKDISGGGCQIVSSLALVRDDRVELEFSVQSRPMRLPATVMRVEAAEDNPGRWAVGLEFTDISEREREHIIRFAFQRQIELRKKGMA